MFCPSCGGSNPDASRFCNQCGGALTPVGGASTGQGDAPPRRLPTDQGTGDRIELPLHGPSRRTVMTMLIGVGLGGLGLGALVAWKTLGRSSDAPPLTPVGLFGEPTSVASAEPVSDGGVAPSETTPTTAPRPARPTTARPTTPSTTPAPPTTARPSPTNVASNDPAPTTPTTPATDPTPTTPDPTPGSNTPPGNTDPTPAAPSTTADASTAAAPSTPDPGGVRERVPGTSTGGVRLGDETDATGHMEDPGAFRFVYNHYRSQIASCHSNASRNETLSGVIVLRVRIGEDGHVRSSRVISDSVRNASLTQCVQTSVRTWRYPRPQGGDVEVDYPMRFGSGGSG